MPFQAHVNMTFSLFLDIQSNIDLILVCLNYFPLLKKSTVEKKENIKNTKGFIWLNSFI